MGVNLWSLYGCTNQHVLSHISAHTHTHRVTAIWRKLYISYLKSNVYYGVHKSTVHKFFILFYFFCIFTFYVSGT